ncbi:hypothetical protein [Bullifex porci]|uniref:hypothetical protein n=1 Tax=Bullifex porci TaxID=2606638 RepID=UPI0023F50E4B|nr:hypothetical protein [Bullifex porci]MDD7255599.1 hypothetical protein [Bullifex porci]MDY2740341.1 hypothetical protein [Bullifex porci]
MKDNVIKECTMNYKVTIEGEDHICDAVQQYAEKSYDKGRTEGMAKALLDLVNKGTITLDYAIENSSLPKEEFLSIAKSLGYKL